jgi:class 3 adenylate cyclase/CHASE2 domain-containing sensor protein
VKLKAGRFVPGLIAFSVIALVCVTHWRQFDVVERLERMTFDMRVRTALRFSPPVATNLGFAFINEESIRQVSDGSFGYRYGLYWPRQVYGRLVEELTEQGARAIAFDIIFGELRPDHPPVRMADGRLVESDEFFALQMRRGSNTIVALTSEVTPPPLFLTNALALGDISTDKDSDGILRRAKAFRMYRKWHPAFRALEADPDFGVDLRRCVIEPRQLILPRSDGEDLKFPLDANGNFDVADIAGTNLPPRMVRIAKPFVEERAWHMGVVLAARELNLDLAKAEVDLPHGRITLHGPGGLKRVIPVDANGSFYIDWCLPQDHPQLLREPIQKLLAQNRLRLEGHTTRLTNQWRGKLVVVGSSAVVGNDLTDRGATPLSRDTLLVSKHWNVANSIITGRFVRRASLGVELALIIVLGILVAVLTWRLPVLLASALVVLVIAAYIGLALAAYVQSRYWVPVVLPVAGACLMLYVFIVAWRVIFEQAERRRVRSIFSKVVSPKIVHELLKAEKLSLDGARREITVLFADVRGFTEFTDSSQKRVAEFVARNKLTGAAADAAFNESARETLKTVNLYLGLVADTVRKEDGTLDKFIGDCVMAFWGAPTQSPNHALGCVRAATKAQRAIDELNQQRAAENQKREAENPARIAAGLTPHPPLPILLLGSGINTGIATAGLMGSMDETAETLNYTVFGGAVNLASRLEGLSGRGRIFISEATYQHLLRDDPALAAMCVARPPERVKGISTPVNVFEVPWRPDGAASVPAESSAKSASDTSSLAKPAAPAEHVPAK